MTTALFVYRSLQSTVNRMGLGLFVPLGFVCFCLFVFALVPLFLMFRWWLKCHVWWVPTSGYSAFYSISHYSKMTRKKKGKKKSFKIEVYFCQKNAGSHVFQELLQGISYLIEVMMQWLKEENRSWKGEKKKEDQAKELHYELKNFCFCSFPSSWC